MRDTSTYYRVVEQVNGLGQTRWAAMRFDPYPTWLGRGLPPIEYTLGTFENPVAAATKLAEYQRDRLAETWHSV